MSNPGIRRFFPAEGETGKTEEFFYGHKSITPIIMSDMKNFPLILFLLLLILPGVYSQETGGDTSEPLKIFPTRLYLTPSESSIHMSWKPADKGESGYIIYRHTLPMDPDNLKDARIIAQVSPEIREYTDTPPSPDTAYFYLVLARDAQGVLQDIFIPFANMNLYGVSVLYTPQEESSVASISGLTARQEGTGITLRFSASRKDRELLVYRNTSPIRSSRELLNAILLGQLGSNASSYRDTPIAGVDYYYALIDSQSLKSGQIVLEAGKNTTSGPVRLPVAVSAGQPVPESLALRPRPLPYLSGSSLYRDQVLSGELSRDRFQPLAPELQKKVDLLIAGMEPRPLPAAVPRILPEDQDGRAEGSDPRLTSILESEFLSGSYETALEMLKNYGKLPRSRDVQYRLHFYLGQSYYFLGDWQNALLEFLFAQEKYHRESQPFLQHIYRKS